MSPTLADLEWPRHTARLSLRPPNADDARAIYEYRRLPEVSHWLSADPGSWDEFQVNFETRHARWLAVEREGRVIGGAKIDIQNGWAQLEVAEQAKNTQAELGWTFHPDVFGQGYGTELARELLAICFEELGLRRVHAGCFADNVASWKIMEKIGMRREGYFVRESLHRELGWLDGIEYAMLAEEWAALQV